MDLEIGDHIAIACTNGLESRTARTICRRMPLSMFLQAAAHPGYTNPCRKYGRSSRTIIGDDDILFTARAF